ncbi:MAG: relaxase/mobilization nuclease domain-containing protein [Lachnospiraceae bacterium]|nr:relaxase/mobilization nuclease domain-containing protein [Lachnospiraceae bacterium]
MAISKVMHMKDSGSGFHGRHLRRSINYILNPDKTQDGRLIGGVNCQPDMAFEQMKETKRKFGKVDQRQGYHIVLSFKEGEITPDTAYEITEKFIEQYLRNQYEVVFSVHDNTDHIHSHIVFNSVSCIDGRKYHYKKGDWEKEIQPITNELCEEYGLSILEIGDEKSDPDRGYQNWSINRDGPFVWSDMIKRDLDACILQNNTFDDFLVMLKDKGYELKQGKYLAVRPPGMSRFKRCKSIGDEYSEERIRQRILEEDMSAYLKKQQTEVKPQLVRCHVKRYRRAKMSGMQKRYYTKLYRIGMLKKKPYSQVYQYKDDIRKMHKLQQQYLFLARHDVKSSVELAATIMNLTDKRKEVSNEKSKIYRMQKKFEKLFEIANQMTDLKECENTYRNGDYFFEKEHEQWVNLEQQLKGMGYSYDETVELKQYYKKLFSEISQKEKAVVKELNLGKSIWKDTDKEDSKILEDVIEKEKIKETLKQPAR